MKLIFTVIFLVSSLTFGANQKLNCQSVSDFFNEGSFPPVPKPNVYSIYEITVQDIFTAVLTITSLPSTETKSIQLGTYRNNPMVYKNSNFSFKKISEDVGLLREISEDEITAENFICK